MVMARLKEADHGVEWWAQTCKGARKVQRFSLKGLVFSLELSNSNPI